MRSRHFLAFFLLIIPSLALADWLPIYSETPAPPVTLVPHSDLDSTRIEVDMSGVEIGEFNFFGEIYTTLTIPQTARLAQTGAPDVPMISFWVVLPPRAEYTVTVSPGDYQSLDEVNILPYSADPDFRFEDFTIYNTNAFFPDNILRVGAPVVFRDVRYLPVQLIPIQANPVTEEARIYENITLHVQTSGTNGLNPKTLASIPNRLYDAYYQRRFINYNEIRDDLFPDLIDPDPVTRLLIITPDDLAPALTDLVTWKNRKGIRTEVATLSETGTMGIQIKGYIQGLYDNIETRPDYLLLIGDHNVLNGWYTPAGDGQAYLSDNPYAYLEGQDDRMDMFVGRLPALPSVLSVRNMVNRVLLYEQVPVIDESDWQKSATLICYQESSMPTKNYIADELWADIGQFDQIDRFYESFQGNEVIALLNTEGRNFLNYRGIIDDYDLYPELINPQGKFPFLSWITCGTCDYATGDFCVQWLRDGSANDPEGAIGVIGGSQLTFPPEYARRRDALDKGVYEGLFLAERHTMGEMILWGKDNVLLEYPLPNDFYTRDTYDHFSLMGDPTVSLWTDVPQVLTVEHETGIPFGVYDVPVTVTNSEGEPVPGARVTISGLEFDDEAHFTAFTDESGTAIVQTNLREVGYYHLVVTAPNAIPYQFDELDAVPGMAIEGTVIHAESGDPLAATVYVTEGFSTTADPETGFYRLFIAEPGTYRVHAELWGYTPAVSEEFTIAEDETLTVDLTLESFPTGTLRGYVTDMNDFPIEGATVHILQEVELPDLITDENGYYEVDLPGSYAYLITIEAENRLPRVTLIELPIGETVDLNVQLAVYQDFEAGDGGFYETPNRDWEYGEPTAEFGPEAAHSGQQVWGTVLDGPYNRSRQSLLYTPNYYFPDDDQIEFHLLFYQWYLTNAGWDGGQMQISTDAGETWELIYPEGGYPDETVVGLSAQAGYTGTSDGWEEARFNLADYVEQWVTLRFRFGATNSQQRFPGWYIDDVVIYGRDFEVSADLSGYQPEIPAKVVLAQNAPNPFNPFTTIQYQLPDRQAVRLNIYDVQGRLITTLVDQTQPAGTYQLVWNGTDAQGQAVRSGVYFYRLDTSSGFRARKSMVLLK
ncbi:MAG: T9SS C-terminal target domain-containing protein [Gemmatimonadetes bacterium]|nr:MAG: T9SS C-terminal target domain-containing protein [Gemmatimonadota bacterium]